ncbi:MAG TPA: tetratricopeptide repeat protein [Vicinamibacterales bacterium]|nr:tetratricopeptide repeat protein [Vicinamibacterales bacterium]
MPFPRTSVTTFQCGGRLPVVSSHLPNSQPLSGHVVVFTGKLSSLGRKDAFALVAQLGGSTADDVNAKTTMLVIGAEGFTTVARSHKLRKADDLNAQSRGQIQILSEDQFCVLAGVQPPEALKRQYHATRDLLARYRSLRDDHVRYLVKCGIVRPAMRTNADTYFTFADVATLKHANDGLAQGLSFRSVVRALMASRDGQLAFDFRHDSTPAKIIALRRPSEEKSAKLANAPAAVIRDTALAEQFFREGSALDDGDDANVEEAAVAYRRALEHDPYLVAALINLANIHYGRDELAEAQALYERAIGLESDFFEAHFNLGNIYHDLNRFAEAQACYHEALRLNPYYADAHFYLAVTFEKMGLSQDARPHWKSYQQLAPQGEWVELAKEFSE